MGLSSNWSIRSCGIYLSGLSWKIWRYQSVKWDWNLICWDNFIPSPEIIYLFSSDNGCVMVVSWQLLSQSLIPLASVYSRGTRYPPHSLLWPHHKGAMSQELKRKTCCMRSQPHERLWPLLLKLNLEIWTLQNNITIILVNCIQKGLRSNWLSDSAKNIAKNQKELTIRKRNWINSFNSSLSIPIPIPFIQFLCNSNSWYWNWNWYQFQFQFRNWPQPWHGVSLS